ncbi:MAG: hypothetical protein JWM40_1691 [Frankiales bacterium]|nr:hypothetical protein [Frankiales bacterium]
MAEVQRIAAELGASSRAVVTRTELVAAKVDLSVVAALVRATAWRRLGAGVYLTSGETVTPLVRAHAAMKYAAGRHADAAEPSAPVLSGLAGCFAARLRWVPEHTRVQVLVGPGVQRASTDDVLLRRTWDVAQIETWSWDGLRVADPTRLVVDAARECATLRDVRGVVLGAVADGLTTPAALRELLDHGAVAKTANTRQAVRDAELGAASPPEAEVAQHLLGRKVPVLLNAEIWLAGRLLGVVDGYVLGSGVGYEVDSVERHAGHEELAATLDRHESFRAAGVELHTTPTRFRGAPDAFVGRLLAVAGSGVEPPGLDVRPRVIRPRLWTPAAA